MTNKAIIFNDNKHFDYREFTNPKLQPKTVIVENKCCGIGYDDYGIASGMLKKNINKYNVLGFGGSGIIKSVSKECIKNYKEGDRVCYISLQGGSFVSQKSVPEINLVPLPVYASFEYGATLLPGLMAYTLLGKVFVIKKNSTIVLTGASGAVGSYFCQMAAKVGFNVIALTRSSNKINYIKSNGAFEVINYKEVNVVDAINHITGGRKADFFFDCLGADVEDFAFDILKNRGFFISFGSITGNFENINIAKQKEKSITISYVSLKNFINTSENLLSSSVAFFKSMQFKMVKPRITTYSFDNSNKVFKDFKGISTVGQKVFLL